VSAARKRVDWRFGDLPYLIALLEISAVSAARKRVDWRFGDLPYLIATLRPLFGSSGIRGESSWGRLVGVSQTNSLRYFWAANLVPRNEGSQFTLLLGRKPCPEERGITVYATLADKPRELPSDPSFLRPRIEKSELYAGAISLVFTIGW